jgi:inorganic pyrophosphatase
MALLDEGETDWKILAIDVRDPLADKLNDVEDVERLLPGLLRATNEWFRIYKIPDGKPENNFAFNGEAKNAMYAKGVIEECYEAWGRLIDNKVPAKTDKYEIACANVSVEGSPHRVGVTDPIYVAIPAGEDVKADAIDASVDKWFYISGAPNL